MRKMETLDYDLRNEDLLDKLTLDMTKSSEIEDESLYPDQVHFAVA